MPDLREPDPIADANRRIRAYVAALPGHRITAEHRAQYDHLVDQFMNAVRDRGGRDEPEQPRLAA